jgi:hypothetical protein
MGNIHRHNYESFFLDALEHRLSSEQEAELNKFLLAHPDLAEEFNSLRDDDLSFVAGSHEDNAPDTVDHLLLVPASQKEVEQLILRVQEGDATLEENILLQGWSAHYPLVQNEIALFEKTKFQADTRIVFEAKDRLLRKEKGRIIAWYSYAAAAAAALLVGLLLFSRTSSEALSAGNRQPQPPTSLAEAPPKVEEQTLVLSRNSWAKKTPTSPKDVHLVEAQPIVHAEQPEEHLVAEINVPLPNTESLPIKAEVVSQPQEEKNTLPMAPILQPQEKQSATKYYSSLWAFASSQAKEKIWGSAAYPQEKFAFAFTQREMQKRRKGEEPVIEFEKKNQSNKESVRFRIGKFEFKKDL